MLGSRCGAAKSCSPGQGSSVSAQLGRGMEEWEGKEKITGKEQDSNIQRISTFLEKRGISLGFVWCGVFLFVWVFFSNEKENFSWRFLSSPSSRLI